MYRIWLLFDPRRALVALSAFLFVLSTDRFNWLEGKAPKTGQIELVLPTAFT
jgi:light-harvesting complex 1 alpha chain